jgi:hypothetical protein
VESGEWRGRERLPKFLKIIDAFVARFF